MCAVVEPRSTGHLAPKNMASTTFAARSGDTSAQPQSPEAHYTKGRNSTNHNNNNNNGNNDNPSYSSDNIILHAHRQNHNSSKLPAFRFADLRKDRISLPSLQQPTPLAPLVVCDTADPRREAQNGLHHYSSAQTLPDRAASFETKQTGGATRTRSLKFVLPSTKTAPSESSPASKRPASFPTNDAHGVRSPAESVVTPVIKRRLTESAVKESVQGQRELLFPKTAETERPGDKNSRPPVSSKTPTAANTANTASTSGGRAVIPPIRAFRSSRKTAAPDMPARRSFEDSRKEETLGANQRDRTLHALEGRRDDDFSHLAPSESGEMTTTTDNDNTADIFMKIAREDPAPRVSEKQPTAPEPVAIVSLSRGDGAKLNG